MNLRLAVLGTSQTGRRSAIESLASGSVSLERIKGQEFQDSEGDCWSEICDPFSLEGTACLEAAQGWVIVLPQDKTDWQVVRAGLVEDLRKLRGIRGSEALTGGLPVFLLYYRSDDTCTPEEVGQFCKELTVFFETGFGGYCVQAESLPENSPEFALSINKVREAIKAAAREYRWRCFWSGVRALVSVFLVNTLFLVTLCAAVLLGLDSGATWKAEYRRLEYGLNPERPILFQVEFLSPLEDRLRDIREFLREHPELSEDSRRRLVDSLNLLEGFVRPLRDSEQWPELNDLKDLASLQSVAESLERWTPPEGKVDRLPLVEKANKRKRDILEASRKAMAVLPALELQLGKADTLLNPSLGPPEVWDKWSKDCLDFQNQPLPFPQGDPLWQLEELKQAQHSLVARKNWVKAARELAMGLGLSGLGVGNQGHYFPEPELERSLEKVSELMAKCVGSIGEDPGFILSRVGLGLAEPVRQRSELCRQAWVKVGQKGLGKWMMGRSDSRQVLLDWLEWIQSKPEWNTFGNWTGWLARCATQSPGEGGGNRYGDPIEELTAFLACDSFSLHPSRIQVSLRTLNGTDSGSYLLEWSSGLELSERHALLESDLVESAGDRKIARFRIGATKPFIWKWGQSLELVLREKNTEKIIGNWKAASPLEAANLFGNSQIRLEWQPKNQGPKVPELLLR